MASSLRDDLRKAWRFSAGLRRYWRAPLAADPADIVRARVAAREQAFMSFVQRAVFAQPRSPYLALLQAARLDAERLVAVVSAHGLEGALQRLYEAGVFVTLDEFKGRSPIQRGSLQLQVTAADFDNPLSANHLAAATGGSRSSGTRLLVDLDGLLEELPARQLHLQAHGQLGRPYLMWMPAPPGLASIRGALMDTKAGLAPARWYSQTRPGLNLVSGKSAYITWSTLLGSWLAGRWLRVPRYAPFDQAEPVARFLAACTARRQPVLISTVASSAARLAKTALELGLDIGGHAVRTSSEPLTEGKAELLHRAGLYVFSVYAALESGMIGFSCGRPTAVDEMHLLTDRLAVLPVRRSYPGLPEPIDALHVTTLSAHSPKAMLNVENGDYATFGERHCGCALGEAGLHQHLHTIRSYEKLSSAGMTFMGHDLLDILDVALPARFGGGPTDYQLVETEVEGETVVKLVVRPELGPLDEGAMVAFVLDELRRRSPAGRLQTTIWRDSQMLRVERAQPYLTGVAKVQALHVVRKR